MSIVARLAVFVGMLALLGPDARADGKGFVRAIENAETPEQRVAVVFDGAQESLIVDTSIRTSSPGLTEAAWIVPVPATPTIEPVENGFFEALEAILSPRLSLRWNWFAAPISLLVLLSVSLDSLTKRKLGPFKAAVAVIATLACVGMFLPALSRARGGTAIQAGSVSVLSAARVGAYETVVLSGSSGQAVLDWLNNGGFHAPPETRPVLDEYCKDGWVFAAARLRSPDGAPADRATRLLRPHPLAFTFPTAAAVYPLRLTGVQHGPCSVKLFAFGPGRASAAGLSVRLACSLHTEHNPSPPSDPVYRWINNTGVLRHLGAQRTATVLTGSLSPDQMRDDATISWTPLGSGIEWSASTFEFAWSRALDLGGSIASIGLAVGLGTRRPWRRWPRIFTWAAIPIAVAAGAVFYHTANPIPTAPAPAGFHDGALLRNIFLSFEQPSPPSGCQQAATALREHLAVRLATPETRADFETPPTEGIGPGQYSILCGDARVRLIYHNATGHEHELHD